MVKTIYRSDILKKEFETEEDAKKAEQEYNEKHALEIKAKAERTKRAHEVEEAYKNYMKLRNEFIKDYHEWHMTYSDKDDGYNSIFDYFFNF